MKNTLPVRIAAGLLLSVMNGAHAEAGTVGNLHHPAGLLGLPVGTSGRFHSRVLGLRNCGDYPWYSKDGRTITSKHSAPCARYYAPYAILAAAAYNTVEDFDKVTKFGQPPGSDVTLAVKTLAETNEHLGTVDEQVVVHAKELLEGWHYEFGKEHYIACSHDDNNKDYPKDKACNLGLRQKLAKWLGAAPAFQVWARGSNPCTEVAIVFRGTDPMSLGDWIANFSPLTAWAVDEHYQQVERSIDGIVREIMKRRCYRKKETQIVSVGHSLGGGLAQLAAFAKRKNPKINKVFSFDTSPNTGNVDEATVRLNVEGGTRIGRTRFIRGGRGLEIDHIYQSGEVLQPIRMVWKWSSTLSAKVMGKSRKPRFGKCRPLVRNVAFDVIHGNLIARHNIAGLAYGIVEQSYENGNPSAPPKATDCRTRYSPRLFVLSPG